MGIIQAATILVMILSVAAASKRSSRKFRQKTNLRIATVDCKRDRDRDCPQIRCMLAPCPQLVCHDGQCLPDSVVCGNNVCEEGEVCCNGFCGAHGNNVCPPTTELHSTSCKDAPGGCPECKRDIDCPMPMCLPGVYCPQFVCEDGQCVDKVDHQQGSECEQDYHCPQPGCRPGHFCPTFACKRGQCFENELVSCPQDTKLCPDGSFVSRAGPDCGFAECPQLYIKCREQQDCPQVRCRLGAPGCPEYHCDMERGVCVDLSQDEAGESCGPIVCGKDEFCCNSSCGTCAPKANGICTQQVCDSETQIVEPSNDLAQGPPISCCKDPRPSDADCGRSGCHCCGDGKWLLGSSGPTVASSEACGELRVSEPCNVVGTLETACREDADCPAFTCEAAPCPSTACKEGKCVLVKH